MSTKNDLLVENWNLKHPVGARVIVTLDRRDDNGRPIQKETVTTSEAYVLSGHTPVVHLDGVSGCYRLDRVKAA